MRIAHPNSYTNHDGFTQLHACWLVCGCATPESSGSARLASISRPTESFMRWAAAPADTAGSDFMHPFEYDPATNSLGYQGSHLP